MAYGAAIGLGTLLLWSPLARAVARPTPLVDAFFTATSAVCVTGLTTLDTAEHWSGFGQAVIMALVQVGGLGVMTLGSLVAVVLTRRLGLRQRMLAQSERGVLGLGDVRRVVRGVILVTATVETAVFAVLTLRLWLSRGESLASAAYHGAFHAVTAFNNAGFALYEGSVNRFVHDPVMLLALSVAVVVGGLGVPVLIEVWRRPRRPRRWSLHTKLTLITTAVLLASGTAFMVALEWTNPGTMGSLNPLDTLVNAWFNASSFRTAGFESLPVGQFHESTQVVAETFMFIGGGSGSTAGGIKVTTFALLGFVMWAEVRGDPDVTLFGRRVPTQTQRQALTVTLLAIGAIIGATLVLLLLTDLARRDVLFEAISAFATVGLSTGVTPELTAPAKLVVCALMFVGRIGPITLFAALVLRQRERIYRFPEERPLIG